MAKTHREAPAKAKNKLDQIITLTIRWTTAIVWVCATSILLRVKESAIHDAVVVCLCMYCECWNWEKQIHNQFTHNIFMVDIFFISSLFLYAMNIGFGILDDRRQTLSLEPIWRKPEKRTEKELRSIEMNRYSSEKKRQWFSSVQIRCGKIFANRDENQ